MPELGVGSRHRHVVITYITYYLHNLSPHKGPGHGCETQLEVGLCLSHRECSEHAIWRVTQLVSALAECGFRRLPVVAVQSQARLFLTLELYTNNVKAVVHAACRR